jgi:hypothetical protein
MSIWDFVVQTQEMRKSVLLYLVIKHPRELFKNLIPFPPSSLGLLCILLYLFLHHLVINIVSSNRKEKIIRYSKQQLMLCKIS